MQKPVEGRVKKIEDRSRIGCSVNQKHAEKPEPPKPTRNQSPFKTLIPHDTTLISAKLASNRKQQHRIRYPKRDATPHPHGCGVKGERAAQREAQMTPCTGKSDAHTKRFSPNAKQTPPNGPTTPTPSGEWLGLRADEGRGKRRYSPG
jgi:hypothetical protein